MFLFLIAFSNFETLSLSCAYESYFFFGLPFSDILGSLLLQPGFLVPPFLYLEQKLVLWGMCTSQYFLHRVQFLLVCAFFGIQSPLEFVPLRLPDFSNFLFRFPLLPFALTGVFRVLWNWVHTSQCSQEQLEVSSNLAVWFPA